MAQEHSDERSARARVLVFWQGEQRFPRLREIALCAFRAAYSSSASERNFLTHAFLHSKLRNRLTSDRVGKLVHVFFNDRHVDEDDTQLVEKLVLEERDTVSKKIQGSWTSYATKVISNTCVAF